MHLCAFTCINAHAALEVHLQNIVVADGTSAEVITVAMRATRFVVFHATPQLPQQIGRAHV